MTGSTSFTAEERAESEQLPRRPPAVFAPRAGASARLLQQLRIEADQVVMGHPHGQLAARRQELVVWDGPSRPLPFDLQRAGQPVG
jgi:hypothetical protein